MNSRKNHIPPETEAQLLDMPELKRGRFTTKPPPQRKGSDGELRASSSEREKNANSNGVEATDSNILDVESAVSIFLA